MLFITQHYRKKKKNHKQLERIFWLHLFTFYNIAHREI